MPTSITDTFTSAVSPAYTDLIGTTDKDQDPATGAGPFGHRMVYDVGLDSADQHAILKFNQTGAELYGFICGDGTLSFPWANGLGFNCNAGFWDFFNDGSSIGSTFAGLGGGLVTIDWSHNAGAVECILNGSSIFTTTVTPKTNTKVGWGFGNVGTTPGEIVANYYAEVIGGGPPPDEPVPRRWDRYWPGLRR